MPTKKNIILVISIFTLAAVGYFSWKYLFVQRETPEQFLERQLVFNVKNQNLPVQAIDSFKKEFDELAAGLKQDPNSLNLWIELGLLKKMIGDIEGAEAAWLRANEINSKNSLSFGNLGDLYGFYLKQPQKAEEMLLVAIANDPKEPQWYLKLSEIYRTAWPEKKDMTDDILLRGLAELPENQDLTSNLATYYREIKDIPKAIEWYEKLLIIWPDNQAAKEDLEELRKQ